MHVYIHIYKHTRTIYMSHEYMCTYNSCTHMYVHTYACTHTLVLFSQNDVPGNVIYDRWDKGWCLREPQSYRGGFHS